MELLWIHPRHCCKLLVISPTMMFARTICVRFAGLGILLFALIVVDGESAKSKLENCCVAKIVGSSLAPRSVQFLRIVHLDLINGLSLSGQSPTAKTVSAVTSLVGQSVSLKEQHGSCSIESARLWNAVTPTNLTALDSWEKNKGVDMKPKGWGKFNELARKLVAVPKEIVNAKIANEKAERKKRRRKK